MELSLQVIGELERIIVDYIYSWKKIRRLAKSVGVEIPSELTDKNEAASLITKAGKGDEELIALTLRYTKKGKWDEDYFQEARKALNIPLKKTMNLEVNDNGNLVSLETFGIKSKDSPGTDNPDYHIFLSHSHDDLEMVKVFVDELQLYGFKVFVAHSDIGLSEEWIKVIEKELNSCKIFIAFLTANFRKSDWCDQESGIAYINNLKIIPLNCDGNTNSYGFINKYQAKPLLYKVKDRDRNEESKFRKDVKAIVDVLMNEPEIIRYVRGSILDGMKDIYSYHSSDCIFSYILKLQPFTEDEFRGIINLSNANNQIYGNPVTFDPLRAIIANNSSYASQVKESYELLKKISKM